MKIKLFKSGYGRLKWKIFIQLVLMILASFILFWVVYLNLWHGRMADLIVRLLQKILFVDYQEALNIYWYYIRNNMEFFILVFMALAFLLFFYFSLNWFVKYFRQIDRGLNALLNGQEQEIILSPEIEVLEKKMNLVRHTLEKRELEAKLAEQRKNDLVMYLAHDIRTPLTSVIGYLSLLEEAP